MPPALTSGPGSADARLRDRASTDVSPGWQLAGASGLTTRAAQLPGQASGSAAAIGGQAAARPGSCVHGLAILAASRVRREPVRSLAGQLA